jgi:hypothetical protein
MKELLLESIYTVEPKHVVHMWNEGHWNYKWNGRKSNHLNDQIRFRREGDGTYVVCDSEGLVWRVDESELIGMLKKHKVS